MSGRDEQRLRKQFEDWISSDPYGKSIARYPNDPTRFAWPGSYRDIGVDLCWLAWQEAWERADRCKDGCRIKRAVKEFSDDKHSTN